MSSKYGFDEDAADPIELPKKPPSAPRLRPKPEETEALRKEGRGLGFVPREPSHRRKPGRRKGEPKTQILVSGPTRVVDRFRDYCEAREITYWEAIEEWLADQDK